MFVIVRHGNTFESGEKPRRIGARTDLPLTAKGSEQARALGAFFAAKGWRFDCALVSPLARTRQTAQAILDAQIAPPESQEAEFLREIDYGPDENLPEADVVARIGNDALNAWERRAEPPEGWEIDAPGRIAAWKALFGEAQAPNEITLLVTSNGAARFALMADAGLRAAAADLQNLKLPTGGFGVVSRTPGGALELLEWGARP